MRKGQWSRRGAVTLGSLLGLLLPVAAQQPPRYTRWQNFTVANGMPTNKVLSVAADGDRVWAGTDDGLVLIVSGRIQRVFGTEDGIAGRVVTAIAVDKNTGSLWIATFGGVSCYSGGQFRNYTSLSSGLANDIVYDIALQSQYVWAATAAGICRLDTYTGEWSIFSEDSVPLGAAQAVAIAGNGGNLYFGIWGSGLVEYDAASKLWRNLGGGMQGLLSKPHRPVDRFVRGVDYSVETKTLWAATSEGLSAFDGRNWQNLTMASGRGATAFVINAIRCRGGGLWLCTDQGLIYFDPHTRTWTTYRGTAKRSSRTIATRVASKSIGPQTMLASPDQNTILNVAFQRADIWVATAGGLSHGVLGSVPDGGERLAAGHNPTPRRRPEQASDTLQSAAVNIGFLGPLENSPDADYGVSMQRGAQLAIEEANAQGGYRAGGAATQEYVLKLHNDSIQWGASTMELVKMTFDEGVVAALGPIDGGSALAMGRTNLALGIPIVYTGATIAALTETHNPWQLRNFPDDRKHSAALSDYIFNHAKLKRVGVIRTPTRTARAECQAFVRASQSIGHPLVVEIELEDAAKDFSKQLRELRDARIDGLAIWADPVAAAALLKQLRGQGMHQPAFGSSRLASTQFVANAGQAAEGLVATCAQHPARGDPRRLGFERAFRLRFDVAPDAYAFYAYDGMSMLISAIKKAGLNRVRIMEELQKFRNKIYDGVSGDITFNRDMNNISPIWMTRVEGGKIRYWPFPEKLSSAK